MLHDKLPVPGSDPTGKAGETQSELPAVGRIIDGRFLIEQDLSDPLLGGRFSSFLVKDLKELCREGILRTVNQTVEHPVDEGPAYQQVCEVMIRLGHPNIEKIRETGMLTDRRPFSIADLADGRSLARLLAMAQRLTHESAALIIERTSEALGSAHEEKVLHCDVRPGNIIISENNGSIEAVRLINFGSAWPIDLRGESLAAIPPGSEPLHYAAPELLSPLGHRSAASDVYSLAALAYRLLAGTVPYDLQERANLLRAIDQGEPPSLIDLRTDLSHEAEQIIFSGLNFEPAWRPQNIEDFGSRLAAAVRVGPRRPVPVIGAPLPAAVPAMPPVTHTPSAVQSPKASKIPPAPANPPASSDRTAAWALIVLLLAGALSIPIGQMIYKEEKASAAVSTMRERASVGDTKTHQLTYLLESPDLSGNADSQKLPAVKFHLSLTSAPAGRVFVFSETSTETGQTVFALVHRSETAGEEITPPRAEIPAAGESQAAWIVWSEGVVSEIEAAAAAAAPDGTINDEAARRLRHFLERNKDLRVDSSTDDLTGRTVLNGSGGRIVHRFAFGQ